MDRPLSDKDVKDHTFLNALSEAYQVQEAILNTTEMAIISLGKDGIITTVNRSAEELFGYKSEELIGKASPLIFHDVDEVVTRSQELSQKLNIVIEPVLAIFTSVIEKSNTAYRDRWTLIKKDGRRFPGLVSFNTLKDFHDEVIGYVVVITELSQDILDNHYFQAQEAAARKIAEENLRIFNNAVTLNVVAGFDGYFRRISSSWANVLGWTIEELKGKPFMSFIHREDIKATQLVLATIKKGQDIHNFESRFRAKDGTYHWLLWSSTFDMEQELIYASAIDISNRKKSEEELRNSKQHIESIALKLQEQNRQLDEFAHIISHNLRSPVGNIKALINLLNENSGIQDYKLIFYKLKNVAQNLSETMNDLMETLKVKTQTDLEKTENRFKDVLDKIIQTLEGDLIMAEASVTYDFNEVGVIYYPKAYLESIIQNLLSNALKYRSPDRKAEIHFQSKQMSDHIELRVTDNGQGIDLEKHGKQLFGLHRTFHEHENAKGVGLFLVKSQLESMGGSITAESHVGKGTTFIVRFF